MLGSRVTARTVAFLLKEGKAAMVRRLPSKLRSFTPCVLLTVACCIWSLAGGCGSSSTRGGIGGSDDASSPDETLATGGMVGSGGAVSTGGASGTGGVVATGGATETGGAPATGGSSQVGSGGATSSGGQAGTGGSKATGGSAGATTGVGGTSSGGTKGTGAQPQ